MSLSEVFIAPGDVLEHSDEMLYFHGEMQGILHFDWLIGKRNFQQQNKLELVEIWGCLVKSGNLVMKFRPS